MTKWERIRATRLFRKARMGFLFVVITVLFPLVWAWDVKGRVSPRANLTCGYRRIWNEEV